AEAEQEADDGPRNRHDVRKPSGFQIGAEEHDQHGGEHEARGGPQAECALDPVLRYKGSSGGKFDEGVPKADGPTALAAVPAEDEVADDRYVVVPRDPSAARQAS